jgi:hypothetical protein
MYYDLKMTTQKRDMLNVIMAHSVLRHSIFGLPPINSSSVAWLSGFGMVADDQQGRILAWGFEEGRRVPFAREKLWKNR